MVFNHHMIIMSKYQILKDLVTISKLCCQELKHAFSFLGLMVPPYCFEGMYSFQSVMYKVQDYNMECHYNGDWLAQMRYGGLKLLWR